MICWILYDSNGSDYKDVSIDLFYPPISAIWRLFLKKSLSLYCGIPQYGNSSDVCMIWRASKASTASKCSLKNK